MDQNRKFCGVISTNVSAMENLQLAEGTFEKKGIYGVLHVPESYVPQIKENIPDACVSSCS